MVRIMQQYRCVWDLTSECPEEEVNDVTWVTRKVMEEMLCLRQVFRGSSVCS